MNGEIESPTILYGGKGLVLNRPLAAALFNSSPIRNIWILLFCIFFYSILQIGALALDASAQD